MTIDEAIAILKRLPLRFDYRTPQTEISALDLGIEALKECKKRRRGTHHPEVWLLPGETDK